MNPDSTTTAGPEPMGSFLDPEPAAPSVVEESKVEAGEKAAAKKESVHSYDFRNPALLAPMEQRKLRLHQEEFIQSMAARLSVHLRLEFGLKLAGIQTITYQKFSENWTTPTHFSLFKLEPARGVALLEISTQLGFCMVDRLMGGPGNPPATEQEISEIEKVLLEQTVQLLLDEWCDHWINFKQLKPVILGYENNGAFIQTIPRDTSMLVVSMEAGFGECKGQFRLAVPYAIVDPVIKRLCQSAETLGNPTPVTAVPGAPAPAKAAAPVYKWNSCFDAVCVPITAEWEGLELTAREILGLKIGDVLRMEAHHTQQVNVRVADTVKFYGRPGTLGGKWAVELTHVIKQ